MGLNVKRSFKICKGSRLELDKKGVGVDLDGTSIEELLNSCKNIKKSHGDISNKVDNNTEIESLTNVHKKHNQEINWKAINGTKPPFDINEDGPNKIKAMEAYENFEPGFFEKVFKFLCENRRRSLLKNVEEANKKDKEIYSTYEKLHILSENILNGNIDAYFQVIDEMIPFKELIDYGSELEFGTNDKDSIEVEFIANSNEVLPKSSFEQEKNEKGDEIDEVTYYEVVEEYVCSSLLLIAKNVMNLLPVNKVVVHAVDNVIDIDTGVKDNITILSVVFDRITLNKINFKTINQIDALDYFICNVRHQKASGFKSVERIVQY